MTTTAPISEEQFEETLSFIQHPQIVDILRAHDSAQRDAIHHLGGFRSVATEFLDKTEWVQTKDLPIKYLGKHRADVIKDMLDESRHSLGQAVGLLKALPGLVMYPGLSAKIEAFLASQEHTSPPRPTWQQPYGKPDWASHAYAQIFQNDEGKWFGVRAGWNLKAHISDEWKGRQVSLLNDDGGFLAYGDHNPDWENSLEQRPIQQEAQGAQCCEPTAEEKAALQAGDYTPEELWGGPRPTCPQCIAQGAQAGDDGYVPSPEEHSADLAIRDRVEGRAAPLEAPGVALLVAHGTVTGDQGSGEVYLVPPAAANGDDCQAQRDELLEALVEFYEANQARLTLLTSDVYLAIQRLPGMRDALYRMDDAQHAARKAIDAAMSAQGDGGKS